MKKAKKAWTNLVDGKETPRKPFWVRILWGAVPEDNEPCEYDFDTRAELNAFMDGVDAASGWLDYEIKAQVSDKK